MKTSEENLIERIQRRIPSTEGGVLQMGIGDDAAVLRAPAGVDWVVTSDPFLENVHFLATAHPPEAVGYKALARATSDIAAMGAQPEIFLLSLAIPANRTGRWFDRMLAGMSRAAKRFGLRLAGGDTAQSAGTHPKIALNITVMGLARRGRFLRRSGARLGDAIFVSGRLGGAQLGLELILREMHRQSRWKRLVLPQFYPVPALKLGQWLAQSGNASAAMDISDGLSSDLHRLCRASGAGARIDVESLPCVEVPGQLHALRLDALSMALHGGEDYGLLFTVPGRWAARIPKRFRGIELTRIGDIVRGNKIKLIGPEKERILKPLGWDHFRARRLL